MLKLILECPLGAEELQPGLSYSLGVTNKISNAAVQILRLPEPNKLVPRARIGDPVKGRIVVQYVGPLIVHLIDEPATLPSKAKKPSPRVASNGKNQIHESKKRSNHRDSMVRRKRRTSNKNRSHRPS